MVSAGARAYNRSLGAEPPAGVQGAEPPVGARGQSRPEAKEVFVLKTLIFNASVTVLHEIDVGCCLSCLWIHNHNLLSSHCRTAYLHQMTSAWIVLRVARWAQGKTESLPCCELLIHLVSLTYDQCV